MSKATDLARKLKALAERGEGGEAANAAEALEKLMLKHNITAEDIESETEQPQCFKIDSEHEHLFFMVAVTVVGNRLNQIFINQQKEYILPCTYCESIEIGEKFEHYLRHYEKELQVFNTAFQLKHELFNKDNAPGQPPPNKELEQLFNRAQSMSSKIDKTEYHKQLQA